MPLAPSEWSEYAREHLILTQYDCLIRYGYVADNFQKKIKEIITTEKTAFITNSIVDDFDVAQELSRLALSRYDNMPTVFEHPPIYAIFTSITKNIEKVLAPDEARTFKPIIGTILTGRLGAQCSYLLKTNEYLMLFESGLPIFVNLMSKVFSEALFFNESGEFIGLTLSGPAQISDSAAEKFFECVMCYTVDGDPGLARQYFLDKRIQDFSTSLTLATEMFVAGHEYAHMTCGHYSSQHDCESTSAQKFKAIRSWEEEFEADAKGLELCALALNQAQIPGFFSIIGAAFFFQCDEIIHFMSLMLDHGREWESRLFKDIDNKIDSLMKKEEMDDILGSHPPSRMRMEVLLGKHVNDYELAKPVISRIGEISERFIDICAPILFKLHENGYRTKSATYS